MQLMNEKIESGIFDTIKIAFLIFLGVVTLYPFLNVIAVSFNDAQDSIKGGITLWPREPTTFNYTTILKDKQVWWAFGVSVLRTLVGITTSVFCTAMVAYVLSRKDFVFRKPFTLIYFFTMYFGAGLIPVYLLMKALHLTNTFTIYWLPGLVSAWNLIIVRTYIGNISPSLIESALIDGAGHFLIFLRIILPLCLPVLACLVLFVAVGHWNDWFTTYLYNSGHKELSVLQYELMKKILDAGNAMSGSQSTGDQMAFALTQNNARTQTVTPLSIRAAMTVIATLPIIIAYPFLQRYFISGISVGGVKE